jgi:hypothetical protein
MRRLIFAAALALFVIGPSAWAQVPATKDQDADVPQSPMRTPAPAQPIASKPGTGGMPMNGMGNNMPIRNMMGTMRMMRPTAPGTGGMATIDRVEGRIAFLRTELMITDAQATAWNDFAEALRTNAKKLGEVCASMMAQPSAGQQQAPTLADRLELQERWLLARLEGTRTIKVAFTNLYGALSDDQKKTANELVAPHMGMGMMTMMQGQMQPGQNDSYGERSFEPRGRDGEYGYRERRGFGPRDSRRDDDYRYGERRGFGPRDSRRDDDYSYGERRGLGPRDSRRDDDYGHGERRGFGPRNSGRDDDHGYREQRGFGPRGSGRDNDYGYRERQGFGPRGSGRDCD